ncbi:MAG: hypothetical protein PVF47_10620 [Anaerolineae bacterium]|jgi:hypothetical protein
MDTVILRRRIRYFLVFFVAALTVSGLTAFPIKWEADILVRLLGPGTFVQGLWPALADWIGYVQQGISQVHERYPFLFYGTDWLAFAHIVIAVAFWGPLRDPVRNVWVVEWAMIACLLVFPLALIMGPVRGIPFFWRLFDCAFGLFGLVPLWIVRRDIRRLAQLEAEAGPAPRLAETFAPESA